MLASDVQVLDIVFGQPSRLYAAGEEEACVVPIEVVMQWPDAKIKNSLFMIAVRKLAAKHWVYMDGSAFQDNPEQLWVLLPQLEKGVNLPEFRSEVLD
jgi:hypothetical protein